jgi:hypothetical protein
VISRFTDGGRLMHVLNSNEFAVLELLAMKPLSFFPPLPRLIARQLARKGLVRFQDGSWHPTAEGLNLAGRTLH